MKQRIEHVTIPASDTHEGIYKVTVALRWVCPVCGETRGQPYSTLSYDGSLRMVVHGWSNLCGHVDLYSKVRNEAINNGLNNRMIRIKNLVNPQDLEICVDEAAAESALVGQPGSAR